MACSTVPREELQQQNRSDFEPVGIFLTWQQDPGETNNLVYEYPEIVEELRELYEEWKQDVESD